MSLDKVQSEVKERMQKSISSLKIELGKVRSGRAHTGILDQISVDYYGSRTPLSQLATVSIADAQTLIVNPYDKQSVQVVDKAIRDSDLGLNPSVNGSSIRVPMPPLTEERRKDLVKLVKTLTENCKVSIRNSRRDANNQVKELLRSKDISEDEERKAIVLVQSLTDENIKEADKIFTSKETDLLAV